MDGGTGFQPEYEQDDAAVLLEQVQANSQALILATVAFLQERDIAVDAWARFIGARFARDWPEAETFGPDEFLDAMLTNLTGFGATVDDADFAPEEATATISGFPDPALCEAYGVEAAAAARFQEAARAIARSQGLTWDWTLDAEAATVTITVTPGAG